MASVSYEALATVKRALQNFQTDVSGAGFSAGNSANGILSECQASIQQTANIIADVQGQLKRVEGQIDRTEQELSNCSYRWSIIYNEEMPMLRKSIKDTEWQIYQLDGQVQALENELSHVDEEAKGQIHAQISTLMSQRRSMDGQLKKLRAALAEKDNEQQRLQGQMASLRSDLSRLESERAELKGRLNRLEGKLARQKSAFARVKSDLDAYISAARYFESSSSGAAAASQSAVNRCIESIESYESVIL